MLRHHVLCRLDERDNKATALLVSCPGESSSNKVCAFAKYVFKIFISAYLMPDAACHLLMADYTS